MDEPVNYAGSLINSITASVIVFSGSGAILSVNPYTCKLLGYIETELIGKPINSVIDIKDIIFEDMWIKFLVDKVQTSNIERNYISKDGTRIPTLFSSTVVKASNGELDSIICMAQDISERKRVEKELDRAQKYSQGLIDSSMDMIVAVDSKKRILEFNRAAQAAFGYSLEEVLGIEISVLFSNPGEVSMIDEEIERTGQFIGEVTGKRRNENTFPLLISASMLRDTDGLPSGYMEVARDITELKRSQALKEELINELRMTNEELRRSQEQLVQSEKMASLGQLVAGVAHEINTPIGIGVTAASHFLEITSGITDSYNTKAMKKSDLERYLKDAGETSTLILRNLQRTADLIISFKMVSSDQTSHVQRVFNLKAYLDDILTSLRPKLKHSPHIITITCPTEIELNSYPGAIAQVITNLIMNSLIHGYEESVSGNIGIEVKRDNDNVVIEYSDDGKGIPPEFKQKIFDPFFTTKRGSGGTGLGLNIVFNVVNQTLKGSIVCDSVVGKGTTFTIRIPLVINE